MQVVEKSSDAFQTWRDTTVWPDLSVETIGIRPIPNVGRGVNSTDPLFKRVKSIIANESTRVIGTKCELNSECNQRVARSHCSYGQRCECLYSFMYDKATDSCYRVKSYNERCSDSDPCRNVLLRCSEFGLCTCHHGFHYEFGKNPYCQPNNSSACDPGQTWDPLRARCVRPRIHTLFADPTPNFANGGYDRNRYSLFFSVILILVLMVILFKSKKSHPFTWDRRSRRMSRSISYAEALGYAFGVRPNASSSHPSHIIPPPHQGPFDIPGDFYDWNPHHHHHHVVHHPHLQSLVVTMPRGSRDGNSVDSANNPCHLIPDVIGISDTSNGVSSSLVNDASSRMSSSGVDPATTCIPPPPYASTLSLATACATIANSEGDTSDEPPDCNRSSSRNIFCAEKPPTYEEAIRYDTTLLPVATDLNNNLSINNGTSALTCSNNPVATCVPGNCRCPHLSCGRNSAGFICLSNSPSVGRCHSGSLSGVMERSAIVANPNDISDVSVISNRPTDGMDTSCASRNANAGGGVNGSNVVVSTTQHCSSSHVPYLTPPVHSLPFSARLRDYPYPVSPWPVVQSHSSSRSERYRLHRSSRPMNYGRSHSIRRADSSADSPAPGSSLISLLRRGTSFVAGVTSRSRSSVSTNHRQQQENSQCAPRRLSSATDHIRAHSDHAVSPSSGPRSSLHDDPDEATIGRPSGPVDDPSDVNLSITQDEQTAEDTDSSNDNQTSTLNTT